MAQRCVAFGRDFRDHSASVLIVPPFGPSGKIDAGRRIAAASLLLPHAGAGQLPIPRTGGYD
jgi:hypothetical protein